MTAALELVCRMVLPAKGRHGRRRKPSSMTPASPLADPDACRPADLIPFNSQETSR